MLDALSASAHAIEVQGQPLVDRLVAQLAARCCEALQQLRGISMTYRMTAKPMPTRCVWSWPRCYAGLEQLCMTLLCLHTAKPMSHQVCSIWHTSACASTQDGLVHYSGRAGGTTGHDACASGAGHRDKQQPQGWRFSSICTELHLQTLWQLPARSRTQASAETHLAADRRPMQAPCWRHCVPSWRGSPPRPCSALHSSSWLRCAALSRVWCSTAGLHQEHLQWFVLPCKVSLERQTLLVPKCRMTRAAALLRGFCHISSAMTGRLRASGFSWRLLPQRIFTSVATAFCTMAAQQLDTLQRTETSRRRLVTELLGTNLRTQCMAHSEPEQPLNTVMLPQGVFTSVATAFATMAAQQLDTLQRTETSLKRLKKARAGEGEAGPGSQLSDMDKILAQLVLDVQVPVPCLCCRMQCFGELSQYLHLSTACLST